MLTYNDSTVGDNTPWEGKGLFLFPKEQWIRRSLLFPK